jgi:hypothetical protein
MWLLLLGLLLGLLLLLRLHTADLSELASSEDCTHTISTRLSCSHSCMQAAMSAVTWDLKNQSAKHVRVTQLSCLDSTDGSCGMGLLLLPHPNWRAALVCVVCVTGMRLSCSCSCVQATILAVICFEEARETMHSEV